MLSEFMGLPTKIYGIGDIFPVRIKDISEFQLLASKCIVIGKDTLKNRGKIEVEYLLDFNIKQFGEEYVRSLIGVLSICMRRDDIDFQINDDLSYYFSIGNDGRIDKYNFEEFRKTIMYQNLLFEPHTEEDDLMQEWLEMAREHKGKDGEPTDIESICQLLCIEMGIQPIELFEYTYYQVMALNNRVALKQAALFVMMLKTQGCKEPVPSTTKQVDLHTHPDDALTKKVNEKLGLGVSTL